MGCQCDRADRDVRLAPRSHGMLMARITNVDDVRHHERVPGARSSSQYRVPKALRPESIWRSTLRSIMSWLGDAAGAVLENASY
jgi:hypothetical protein